MMPGIHATMLMGGGSHAGQFFYAGSSQNIANVYSGTNQLLTSQDGLTWTTRTPPWTGPVTGAVIFGANRYLMAGLGASGLAIATSPDGASWTPQAAPWVGVSETGGQQTAAQFYGWYGSQAYGNGTFVLANYDAVGSTLVPRIATSPDGATWTIRNVPWATGQIDDVIFANGRFVAIGYDRLANATRVISSRDGTTWTLDATLSWSGYPNARLAAGNGIILAVGTPNSHPAAATSADGIAWTNRAAPAWGLLTKAKFLAGKFRVAGSNYIGGTSVNGIIATTTDGIAWSLANYASPHLGNPSGQVDAVNGIAFGANRYVFGGSTGINIEGYAVIAQSTDGVSFTQELTTPLATSGICFLVDYV